jgi:small subunit ribosomal protein S16
MSIVIRMSRQGRTNRPHFRIGVWDVKSRRDGPPVEYLGHYDPLVADDDAKVTLDQERIQYWMGQGAEVTDTVRSFLERRGIAVPRRGERERRRRKARKVKTKSSGRKAPGKGGAKKAAGGAKKKPRKKAKKKTGGAKAGPKTS